MRTADFATETETTTWTVDPTHSYVEFAVKHMMISTVKGRFAKVSGTLVLDAEDPSASRLEAEVDAASIDTRAEQRDQHLRSSDFLDVANHPTIAFVSRQVERTGQSAYRVTGDITIRGVTRELLLEVKEEGRGADPWGGERIGFTARGKLDRRDFGLEWNQALEAGGVLVGHEVRIEVLAQLVEQD